MLKSEVVEVDGVFVGTAIERSGRDGRAFFATHQHVRSLHGQVLPSLAAIRHQATRTFRSAGGASRVIRIATSEA